MKFEVDPFYLYPIGEQLTDDLFIDRETEIELARSTIEPGFKKHKDICAVLGGIGVGKSSFLNMIHKIAKDMNKKSFLTNNIDKFRRESEKIQKNNDIIIVDDVDKMDDKGAKTFYDLCESILVDEGVIFFADTHERGSDIINRRNFTVSQFIILPRELSAERLRFFLEERMKRCVIDEFEFPFEKKSLEMASIRSSGNLRNFLSYTKNGWKFYNSREGKKVTKEDMKEGIINVDSSLLGGTDLIDLKIIWYSTLSDMNRKYLAHQCDIDSKTLDRRIKKLSEFIIQKRSGKEIDIQSIYRFLEEGTEILERIFGNLGIHEEEL